MIDWHQAAACRNEEVSIFYPIAQAEEASAAAKQICGLCRVQMTCLAHALLTGEQHSVWGGTAPDERRTIRRRAITAHLPRSPAFFGQHPNPKGERTMIPDDHLAASVRYIVDDVRTATEFYVKHLGFRVEAEYPPAFAEQVRGNLRLLLCGPMTTGAKATPLEAAVPGRNRIHIIVDNLDAAIEGLRAGGVDSFRSEPVVGFGGNQVLLADPSGNLVELFMPTGSGAA